MHNASCSACCAGSAMPSIEAQLRAATVAELGDAAKSVSTFLDMLHAELDHRSSTPHSISEAEPELAGPNPSVAPEAPIVPCAPPENDEVIYDTKTDRTPFYDNVHATKNGNACAPGCTLVAPHATPCSGGRPAEQQSTMLASARALSEIGDDVVRALALAEGERVKAEITLAALRGYINAEIAIDETEPAVLEDVVDTLRENGFDVEVREASGVLSVAW